MHSLPKQTSPDPHSGTHPTISWQVLSAHSNPAPQSSNTVSVEHSKPDSAIHTSVSVSQINPVSQSSFESHTLPDDKLRSNNTSVISVNVAVLEYVSPPLSTNNLHKNNSSDTLLSAAGKNLFDNNSTASVFPCSSVDLLNLTIGISSSSEIILLNVTI